MARFFFASLFLVICLFDAYEGTDAWCNFKEGEYETVVNILVFINKMLVIKTFRKQILARLCKKN